ncbi:MAG: hypothetical protein AB1503_08340 [Bacillota bacterium]
MPGRKYGKAGAWSGGELLVKPPCGVGPAESSQGSQEACGGGDPRPAWANSAFNKLMVFGATPADVVPEISALAVLVVLFGALAVWRFRLN